MILNLLSFVWERCEAVSHFASLLTMRHRLP